MIESIGYLTDETERRLLEKHFRYEAGHGGNEKWNWYFSGSRRQIEEHLREVVLLDAACISLTGEKDISYAKELRRRFGEMMMMLVADSRISPMEYLKPSVMPASLLIRPWKEEDLRQVVHEFVAAFLGEREGNSSDSNYVLETKEGKTFIPYEKISCFEAGQKKVFIRVEGVEYETYDTIERLAEALPEEFVRSHRSFIVNKRKIDRISMKENLIYLSDGTSVPVSRSYRSKVRSL